MEESKNNNNKMRRGPMGRGPMGRGAAEKPKDFKKAIKKISSSLQPFYVWVAIAIVLSVASAVFSIIGPDKLKDLTSEIQVGLVLDKNKITEVAGTIMANKAVQPIDIDGVQISPEEQMDFLQKLKELTTSTEGEIDATKVYSKIDEMPKSIVSIIKPKMNMKEIWKIVTFLGVIYVLSAAFNFIQGFIMADVSNNYAKQLRRKIIEKVNKLPLKFFDAHTTGDTLSTMTNDVDTMSMAMNSSLSTLASSVTLLIGSVVMMFYTNWVMAITAIMSSLIGFAFMGFIMGKSQKYFNQRQTELGKLNGHIEEVFRSLNIVKTYNGEEIEARKFEQFNQNVYNANRKSQFLGGLMQPMMNFIGNFSYVAVCVVGSLLAINGKIEFGVIVAFMMYVRLFTSPLSQIGQGMTQLQTATAASERVFEFLEEAEMEEESVDTVLDASVLKGNIVFDHVKFGYDDSKLIIKDFSCNVKSGQKIAIVGPTGAGKTTLVNLLMKFYNINSGKIEIDGVDTKNLTRETIHNLFIMVLQDTWLFNGTIRDNIKYNKENVTDEQIWKALEAVGARHLVKSLPGELDYVLQDSDSGISAGQKQLLTIARGMIKDSPFLILDEATSSVDTRTEELVQQAMDSLSKGRTSFIIAHRLSTIRNADLILVMNEGNIIEQGNHEELMRQNGFYAELYNSQFKKASREI